MPTATTKEKVRALVAAQLGGASYFLKIDGIQGESRDKDHRDEIELQSFAWGNSSAEPQGGGGGSPKVTFQDFQLATPASKAGPQLMLHCATGKRIRNAVMTGRREAGRTPQEYLKITLEEVLVASYLSNGSSGDGGAPMDTASLRFGKIVVEYTEFTADGKKGETVRVSFDIAKGIGT